MLGSSDVIAFVPTTDPDRARAFYEQTLGLPLVGQFGFTYTFDANGTILRVIKVPRVVRGGYNVLGWRVSDITAIVRDLAARGVVFLRFGSNFNQDEDGVSAPAGGDKMAWFDDPDGNRLTLTQDSDNSTIPPGW